MVMGVIEGSHVEAKYPELAGARILITGLESGHGVDIARAFAEQGCRLVVQTPALDTLLEVLLETLVKDAGAVHVTEGVIGDEATALKCAQSAIGVYGGLDVVINLARLDEEGIADEATERDIEDRLAATLRGPLLITRVIANRMQLTWREGLILNVVSQRGPQSNAEYQLGRIANTAVAALTKREAAHWADKAVRVNAIVPAVLESCEPGEIDTGLYSEPEIATLALRLASHQGRTRRASFVALRRASPLRVAVASALRAGRRCLAKEDVPEAALAPGFFRCAQAGKPATRGRGLGPAGHIMRASHPGARHRDPGLLPLRCIWRTGPRRQEPGCQRIPSVRVGGRASP